MLSKLLINRLPQEMRLLLFVARDLVCQDFLATSYDSPAYCLS